MNNGDPLEIRFRISELIMMRRSIMKKYTSIKVIFLLFVMGLRHVWMTRGIIIMPTSEFYVDMVGIQHTYTIKQFSSFALTPKFIYDGDKVYSNINGNSTNRMSHI